MLLKFGQIKEWEINEFSVDKKDIVYKLLNCNHMFSDFGYSLITTRRTNKSVKATIEIVKLLKDNAKIKNDWDGATYNKKEAIKYIQSYSTHLERDKSWEEIEKEIREDSKDITETIISQYKDAYYWFEENIK